MTGNLILSQITCNFKIIRSTGKFPVSRTKEVTATYRNLPVCAFNTELVHKHLNNVHTYPSTASLLMLAMMPCRLLASEVKQYSSKLCCTLGYAGDWSLSLSSPSSNALSCAFTPLPVSVQAAPARNHDYQVLQVSSTHSRVFISLPPELRSAGPFLLPQYPFPRYSTASSCTVKTDRGSSFTLPPSSRQTALSPFKRENRKFYDFNTRKHVWSKSDQNCN